MRRLGHSINGLTALALSVLISASAASTSVAQMNTARPDMSPVLLIETGPSDNPDYRRMVFVKYLAGQRVTASYKAYNRTEFIQMDDTTPNALVAACANGPATTLEQIRAYEAQEAQARRAGAAPQITHFCIKGVPEWEAGNRVSYLDPIFEGMPYAATLNN